MTPTKTGPLAGVRVLDLTSVMMGPYCTQILADLGADVIKVESPEGDVLRALPPARTPGNSAIARWLLRGKRSVVLNLKTNEGRELLLDLARQADVFIHSMRPQAIESLGLDYAAFRAVNARLVYCNLYGFGRGGRYAGMAAYDDTIQAACGLAMLQKEMLGTPSYVASVVADKICGLTGVYAVTSALLHRERTGHGQEVDVPMFETMTSFVLVEHLAGAVYTQDQGPPVYRRAVSPSRRPYATQDGFISVLVYNDKQWKAFAQLVGKPALATDPRFASLSDRSRNVDEWCAAVAAELTRLTTDEWLDQLSRAGVPAMRLNTTEDLLTDPHLQDVNFFVEVEDPQDGRLRMPRPPVIFSDAPCQVSEGGPALDADTDAVLAHLGLSAERIRGLRERGAIGAARAVPAQSE